MAITGGLEDVSESELKNLKRDHAIRERAAANEIRRQEEEDKARVALEQAHKDQEMKAKLKRQKTMNVLALKARTRAEQKAKIEKLNAKRENNIKKRQEEWLARANSGIAAIIDEDNSEKDKEQELMGDARRRKAQMEEATRRSAANVQQRHEELEMQREDNEAERATDRMVKELHRVDGIKADAEEELKSFIQQPAPIPLRQVLAGRIRPVPRVTQLLCCWADQKAELQELEDADIPMRALLRKRTIFQYIRDIQQKADETRLRPPEPVIGDFGRGVRSKQLGGRSPKSPGSRMCLSPGRRRSLTPKKGDMMTRSATARFR